MIEMTVEGIAMVCHEANRAICEAAGDLTQVAWKDAAQWQVQSAIKGVKFRLENLDAPVRAQHEAWCEEKIKEGWRYGPMKDAEQKTHPCLVRHDALPFEQQVKDYVFVALVRALTDL